MKHRVNHIFIQKYTENEPIISFDIYLVKSISNNFNIQKRNFFIKFERIISQLAKRIWQFAQSTIKLYNH
jgi:hypothetical protein